MAIRNISYTVSADGIAPATEQFGGTQEEHNATSLTFGLSSALQSALSTYLPDYELAYRFDIYDGEGNVIQCESHSLAEDGTVLESVTLELTEPAARYGGKISVYLVITAFNDDGTKLNLYSFPAKLKFRTLPDGGVGDNNTRESITTLAESAKFAALSAVNSATLAAESEEAADNAKQQTFGARFALENGAKFVFKGGSIPGSKVNLVVDSELSEVSENPVQNKAVTEELNKKVSGDDMPSLLSDFIATESFRNAVFLANHPVGSIYATVDATDPGGIYGGGWLQVAEGKALVGVGTGTDSNNVSKVFVVGDNDGEYKHALTEPELASHKHPELRRSSAGSITRWGTPTELGLVDEDDDSFMVEAGGDQPHNNTQPTYGVYIWKRTT